MTKVTLLMIGMFILLCTAGALALLQNNPASDNMSEEVSSALMSEALQATTMSKENPFATLGEDFLVVGKENYAPVLYIPFDNTNIYIDIEDDGVWEERIVRNAGDSYTVSMPTVLYGTRIHTDKPVIYWQHLHTYRYEVIPPISALPTSYYVYGGTWYAVVPENTTIHIDNNNDGTIDSTINATPLTRNSISASNFARVFADKPFYLYYAHTLATSGGTDFYLSRSNIHKLIVTEDNTLFKIDKDNDGHYDEERTLNKGVVTDFTGYTFDYGTHIWTDKPVAVYSAYGGMIYYVLPSNMVGNDMWSPGSDASYYITGLFKEDTGLYSNTTYYMDKVTDNDLVPDATGVVNANQCKSLSTSLGMVHIWGTMPFYESFLYSRHYSYPSRWYYWYHIIPYSSITATAYGTQKVLGANEPTEIYARVFNPFATTTANNLSITVPIPKNFSLLDGNNLTLNTEKRFLRNDTVIANDTIVVSPTNTGENFVFTITQANVPLLSSLEPMTYYDLRYQVVTPSEYGSYRFEPVSLNFDAETWNMPQ